MKHGTKFKKYLEENLNDPKFAAEYLVAALEQGDNKFLTEAMLTVVKVHGASKTAGEAGIARQAVYKMLTNDGNPSFKNIVKLLEVMGLEITIRAKRKKSS